jgi:hypothetical protein
MPHAERRFGLKVVSSVVRTKAFRSSLAQLLRDLGYKSSKVDPDVWMRASARDDGHKYYEMLFVYVDDILAMSHRATDVIKEITEYFKAKEGSIRPPEIYLGANILKMQLPDGREGMGDFSEVIC